MPGESWLAWVVRAAAGRQAARSTGCSSLAYAAGSPGITAQCPWCAYTAMSAPNVCASISLVKISRGAP